MRLESKSVKVDPIFENDTIKKMGLFGWTLLSSQEVHNHLKSENQKYTDMYRAGANNNSNDYVKLVFQRDKDMKNYSLIVKYEQDYNDLKYPDYVSDTPNPYFDPLFLRLFLFILIIFGIVGVTLGTFYVALEIYANNSGVEVELPSMQVLLPGLFMLLAGFSLNFIIKKKKKAAEDINSKQNASWKMERNNYLLQREKVEKQKDDIVSKVQSLIL